MIKIPTVLLTCMVLGCLNILSTPAQHSALAQVQLPERLQAAATDLQGEYPEIIAAQRVLISIGEPAVPFLIQTLNQAEYFFYRVRLVETLGKIGGKQAISTLLLALDDKHAYVRSAATDALLAHPQCTPNLIEMFEHPSLNARISANFTLAKMNKQALPALTQALTHEKAQIRSLAARTLRDISDPLVAQYLIPVTRDPSPIVRENAVWALGWRGNHTTLPVLLPVLKDPDSKVRNAAATALGIIADKRALSALLEAALDPEPEVRTSVMFALGRIQDPAAIPIVIQTLKDEFQEVRLAAAEALFKIGDKSALAALKKAHDKERIQHVQQYMKLAIKELESL